MKLKIVFLFIFICINQIFIFAQRPPKYTSKPKKEQSVTPSVMDTPIAPPIPETGNIGQDMLTSVNNLRARGCKCGGRQMPPVTALRWNGRLATAAQIHANDMNRNNFMSHRGSDGSTFVQRIEKQGYLWRELGENVSKGGATLQATMQSWLNSVGHCEQMMSANTIEMGAARSGNSWVQDFGTPQ